MQSKSWPCLSLHPLNPHIHIQPHIIVSERVCTHFLWENEYILSVLKRAHVVCVITSVGDWICVTAIVSIVVAVAAFAFSHCRIFAHFIFEFVSKICTELIHLCRLQLLSINSSVCRCNMLVDCVIFLLFSNKQNDAKNIFLLTPQRKLFCKIKIILKMERDSQTS